MTASLAARPLHPATHLAVRRVTLRRGPALELAEQGRRDGRPTLLMLHGITDSWRSFEPVLPFLPADQHVIAPSQRGHGGSDKPSGGYRTRDFAADAAELIDQLDLADVIVVGHSMGAANAMKLVIDHPGRVRGLVAAGAFARFDDKAELGAWVAQDIATLDDPVPWDLAWQFQLDTVARPVASGLIETATQESLRVPAHVWRQAFAGLLEADFSDDLHRIDVPTLLIAGDADRFVPATDTAALQRAIASSRSSTWASGGHAMHWEQPERFAHELVKFVDDIAASRRG